MIITVKLYLSGKTMGGKEAYSVELPQGATVDDLALSLNEQIGNIAIDDGTCFMIKQRAVAKEKVLCDGDCVLILKPLAGG
ncbi:MAG: MoaD/ThiS family protein [Proteobacteria bacterium]|nr:MoaD/ThiS family protein [Pseudomonadota bacterium]